MCVCVCVWLRTSISFNAYNAIALRQSKTKTKNETANRKKGDVYKYTRKELRTRKTVKSISTAHTIKEAKVVCFFFSFFNVVVLTRMYTWAFHSFHSWVTASTRASCPQRGHEKLRAQLLSRHARAAKDVQHRAIFFFLCVCVVVVVLAFFLFFLFSGSAN